MKKKGILLVNLGEPNNADGKSVYRYLKQFLNDLRVVDLPIVLRWVLTNLIIVPFRYKKSVRSLSANLDIKCESVMEIFSKKFIKKLGN